jgi:hypothetical protein
MSRVSKLKKQRKRLRRELATERAASLRLLGERHAIDVGRPSILLTEGPMKIDGAVVTLDTVVFGRFPRSAFLRRARLRRLSRALAFGYMALRTTWRSGGR